MDNWEETHDGLDAIAIIGMTGRFPHANNLDDVESISLIGEQEEIDL